MPRSSPEKDAFDPNSRRLCPDGACVGVLDDAGVCPICGRRGAAGSQGSAEAPRAFAPLESAGLRDAVPEGAPPESDGFDTERRLCPDGSCLGVLGPNGRCNVCGRSAS